MRSVLVLVATIGTIVFNGLAAAGYVNGVTPAEISDKYPTVITPAGYAFSIWSLIYVGLIAFSIYQLTGERLTRLRPVRLLYIISCVLNCGWIYFWHRDQIAVCAVLIALLLVSLILIISALHKIEGISALLTKVPFGIYAGWVTAATLVNGVILLKYLKVDLSQSAWNGIGIGALLLAAAMAALIRFRLRNYIYGLAIAWAAAAIGIKQSGNTLLVITTAFTTIIGLLMAISFVMDQKSSTSSAHE
jgi:hypothetical protein